MIPEPSPAPANGLDFEALFRASPAGAVIADRDDLILDVNEAFIAWTGLSRDSLVGTSFSRLLPVADRILFATRTRPMLDLNGSVPEIALTITGHTGLPLTAAMVAARVRGHSDVAYFLLSPRRERSFEEAQLISAVHRAEDSDSRRHEAEQDLDYLTRHDPLTGLLNRAGFIQAHQSLQGVASPSGMYWVGLDHFRVINDSLGRAAGDEILTELATRLAQHYATTPTVLARVGGDEFAVATDSAQIENQANDLMELIAGPITIDDLEIVVSASIGVTQIASEEGPQPSAIETMLRNAQTGMYDAKASGRNQWKRFTAQKDNSAITEIHLLGEIRTAIAHNQLRLEYQPQLDLRTGRLHGFEALIRWDHPERGLVGPSGFIDIAEKTGLIVQLGTWACRTAIAQTAALAHDPDLPPSQVSVNISARQLIDRHFPATIRNLFTDFTLDPARLTLELTETALITDSMQAIENLRRLKKIGVRVSIDDFGTGHAGFSYLDNFPADEIKIDRSYTNRLHTSPEVTAIVASCIELAHTLNMTVIAEGVETNLQLEQLTQLGCDIIQGFHYSRPLRTETIHEWARQQQH